MKKKSEDSGAPLPLFLAPSQLKAFIDKDLEDGPLKVIEYVDGDRVIRAFNAEVLPAVCEIWLRAREKGALQDQQLPKAQQAELLTPALEPAPGYCKTCKDYTIAEPLFALPVQPAPYAAIASILKEVMEIAVENGANSISMPGEYVEVALWLSYGETAAPSPKHLLKLGKP